MSEDTPKAFGEILSPTAGTCFAKPEENACLMTFPVAPTFISPVRTNIPTPAIGQKCPQEFLSMCLVTPPKPEKAIFGFAEFVAAFALLVIVYTVTDVRYRFRVAVAPIPLWGMTFVLLGIIGFGSLFTDFWFANQFSLPALLSNQTYWQTFFGGLFLALALTWVWYAFIHPPIFGRRNYLKFAQTLFRYILRGSDTELPAIAVELAASAESIVKLSRTIERRPNPTAASAEEKKKTKDSASEVAYDVLLLIGNRKLCRHIIASSPITAIAFFEEMDFQEKHELPLSQFAMNISTEALMNRDSILYHEDQGYYSGLLGYVRRFSNAVYGNFRVVEALASNGNSPLDINYRIASSWDAAQLEAYCRAVTITLESYFKTVTWREHSYALFRALNTIEHSCGDLYKLDGNTSDYYTTNIYQRLAVVVNFFEDAIEVLEKNESNFEKNTGLQTRLRKRGNESHWHDDMHDRIAQLMFEIIFNAATVTKPTETAWSIHYGAVWSTFFGFDDSKAWKIIRFKLRRLLYDEIRQLATAPNYKSSRILGYCLNVMGLTVGTKKSHGTEYFALRKAVLGWAERNYLRLREVQPEVAESCLIGRVTFDEVNSRLVKTFSKGLELEPHKEYLPLKRLKS